MKSFLFPDNDFGTLAFLFDQSCLCVTFTSWSTPSFGMILSKLSNRNTRVHIQYQNDQLFYPSVWMFKSCNVSNNASLVSTRTGRGGGQPNVDKPGQGEGVPKILKFVRTSCMDDPYINNPTTNSGTCC